MDPEPDRDWLDLGEFVRENFGRLCGVLGGDARRAGLDPADVVQEALSRAHARSERFASSEAAFRWVAVTARNLIRDHVRSSAYRRECSFADVHEAVGTPSPDPEACVVAAEERCVMRRAFRLLPERQRALLHAYAVDGRSRREIASSLGLSADATRKQIDRAERSLRRMFDLVHRMAGCERRRPGGRR